MDLFVTRSAQGDQVLFGIITQPAARLYVMHRDGAQPLQLFDQVRPRRTALDLQRWRVFSLVAKRRA